MKVKPVSTKHTLHPHEHRKKARCRLPKITDKSSVCVYFRNEWTIGYFECQATFNVKLYPIWAFVFKSSFGWDLFKEHLKQTGILRLLLYVCKIGNGSRLWKFLDTYLKRALQNSDGGSLVGTLFKALITNNLFPIYIREFVLFLYFYQEMYFHNDCWDAGKRTQMLGHTI